MKGRGNWERLEKWKKANVTPIFKKGRKEDTVHYMLVSHTLIFVKLMDQLILAHRTTFPGARTIMQ